jgi:hypothetical protein
MIYRTTGKKMAQDHNRPHALEDYDIILPISYFMLLLPHTFLHFLLRLFPFIIFIFLIITISYSSSSSLSPFVSFLLSTISLPPTLLYVFNCSE